MEIDNIKDVQLSTNLKPVIPITVEIKTVIFENYLSFVIHVFALTKFSSFSPRRRFYVMFAKLLFIVMNGRCTQLGKSTPINGTKYEWIRKCKEKEF